MGGTSRGDRLRPAGQLLGRALPGRRGQALGPARAAGAAGCRGVRAAVVRAVRAAGRRDDRGRAGRLAGAVVGRGRGRRVARAQGRPAAGLLGPRPGRVHPAGARAVPLVRRRLEGQRGTAGPGGLRRRHQLRPAPGRGRVDSLRRIRGRGGRGGGGRRTRPWCSTDTAGKKISSSFLYNATRSMYEKVGFAYERPKGKNHCMMRKVVPAAR
jgi:hypothetical protein